MNYKHLLIVIFFMVNMLTSCESVTKDATISNLPSIRLATTTSTYDSGLLDYILPQFEQTYNVKVEVIAVGTGQALELGSRGDVDVVLVHAREREDDFVEQGYGIARYDVMYNDFVIVGPSNDPADLRTASTAGEAFRLIAESTDTFISRGDDSGTHIKELEIWFDEGSFTFEDDWYYSIGQGMGPALTMAEELRGYTLSDRATYLSRKNEGLSLEILFEGDPILFNPYGVIPVNPSLFPHINAELSQNFVNWLISPETQKLIGEYQIFGEPLFVPNAN